MTENQQLTNQTKINASGSNIAAIQSGSGTIRSVTQNIGVNLDEVANLIQSLKSYAQTFPEEQKADVEISIEDLESDLSDEKKRTPARLTKRLLALWTVACLLAGSVAGAADFSNNILELSEKLGVPFTIDKIQQNPNISNMLPDRR
jgi:hypothetical protein